MDKINKCIVKITYSACTLLLLLYNYSYGGNHTNGNLAPPPVNDNCSGATTLTVNRSETCSASTTAIFTQATVSAQGTTCTPSSADVWYQFTATTTSHTIAISNFSGTPQPMVLVLYEGDCTGLVSLYCSQNNVINATGLVIGSVYKVKVYLNSSSPSTISTFSICVTTPPPPASNNQHECLVTTINYNFETPDLVWSTYPTFVNHNVVQGWRTTASDQTMEFWQQPNYENVPAYDGTQFIELNANVVSGVYQDYNTPRSTVFTYGFAHRGRQGTDSCQLMAGPPGGPYVNVGPLVTTSNTAWSYNTGTYTVPAGQTVTRFMLQSVSSVGGASVGNFLDAISFTANNGILTPNPFNMDCGDAVANLSAAGVGNWLAHTDNPSTVTISDPSANNVEISNFGPSGSYYFDWVTEYCISTIEITYTGPFPQDPVISNVTYCQNQTASPLNVPVTQPDYTILYFLNGRRLQGIPTPGTSVIGTTTYNIVQESAEGCQTPAFPLTVTITAANTPITNFSLPAAVCTSDQNPVPSTVPGFTFGGTYSAPEGIAINSDTGQIDLSNSVAGVYDITYTINDDPQNCVAAGSSTTSITILSTPDLEDADPVVVCDDDYNGLMSFDLTTAINQILNNQTGFTATVHLTDADARTGANPQSVTNFVSGTRTVYVRAYQEGSPNCYSVTTILITVNSKPVLGTPANYELCDANNSPNGIETFNLTTKNTEVSQLPGAAITYYESEAAAQEGNTPITSPQAYENTIPNRQEIWVRVENEFGCYSTTSFNLIVNPLPVIDNNLEPAYACEEVPGQGIFDLSRIDPIVTMGVSGYNVSYYETWDDAQNPTDSNYINTPYTSPSKMIYVRVQDANTGCFAITTLNLEALPAPIATEPQPLEVCNDNNGDFVAVFDMTQVINNIISDLGAVQVTIHETEEGAIYDGMPILNTSAYSNVEALTTNGRQTVYIRVDSSQTSCFDVVALQLIVQPKPEAVEPAPYEVCDENSDGLGTFNLSTINDEVLGSLSPALYTVEYYESADAANDGTTPIPNPTNYAAISGPVYVRVKNNTTGCFDIVTLELIVNPMPQANNPQPYTLCDVNEPGNEKEVFDLTTKIPEIIGTQEGINVTFYRNFTDAQEQTDLITSPSAYTNGATVETLFARVTIEDTGCYRIVLLDVRVEPLPILDEPDQEDLTICDPDGDGVAAINLQDLVEGMINNGRDITLAFYETPENAENNLFPISNVENYVNQDPYFQTIYVVAENTVTGCKNVNPFMLNLVIVGSPQLPNLDNLVLCDEDTSNQDQATRFDLTQQDTVIEAALGANPGDYIIHYFINETFAQEGAPRITNPSIYNGTNEQTIWVRVEDPATECYGIGSFKLQVRTPLAVVTPPMLAVCNTDLPPDIQAIFDLTTMDATILGPNGVGQGYTVTYYESQDNVNNNISITNPESYSNPAGENPKTLFVVVTTTEGCRSYTTLTVKVLPLPTPNTAPDALELCDDNNSPDGVESFNLTLADGDIRDNDNSTVLSYHLTLENANLDIADIPDFTNHVSGNATIYVRVEANTNNPADPKCYQVVELQLIVNPLPALGEAGVIPPYAICEPATDGYAVFDLNTHNNKVITGGDTTGYTFRYFRNEASALVGAPALRLEGYTNEDPGRQHVWVRVENTQTDCIIIGTFDLLVELEAVANDPEDGHTCDDIDGVNDGVATYDLTQFTAEVLGTTQPEGPGQFLVEYYETDPQLDPDATPIADPANYRNEASPDGVTIYIRAYNDGTISKCSDYTSVDVIIEQLPRPVLQGGTICVDISGAVLRTHTLNTGLPPEYSFVWYHDGVVIPGATGPAYEADEEGNYAVIATSPSGCVSVPITPVEVLQSGPPSAVGTGYSVSNYFSDEQAVTINVEGYGEYEYKLDDGPWQMSNIFTNVSAGQDHTVQVRDASTDNPCSEFILTITGVNIVDYPKYFTPNGDGYHETWNITGFGDDNADAKIYIFDRFGKLVKQISSQSDGWDGTMNGSRLPSTDYWFTVTYREYINGVETIKEFKSHFSLKR